MAQEKANFIIPGVAPCETWYWVVGDLESGHTPLVVLHGGPGACHDYLLPLADLSAFWTVELFKTELDNLLRHLGLADRPVDIYGHSWGGMLAAEWAVGASSSHLRRLIISSSLASMATWRVGITALRNKMPDAERAEFDKADKTGDYGSSEYQAAIDVFYQRHLCLARPWPAPEVQAALYWLAADPTTYSTMYGPSERAITGSLRDWTIVPQLHKITVPTLLINGSDDEAQDVAMQPFFDMIRHVKWVTLDNAAHFAHVDQREKHMHHVGAFLAAT